jgi:arylsulfatase A-like enzyme
LSNVILLTLDSARKDAFGYCGSARNLSPAFDELASQSLVFTKAHTTGPYTQASFPGLLTASHFLDYGPPKGLSPKRTLVSEPLQEAGVVTAAFHSNPYLCSYLGWNRGWDTFYDSMDDEVEPRIPYVRGDQVTRKAVEWLKAHRRERPSKSFFMWLHYMDVHEPYMPDRRFVDLVDPSLELGQDEMYGLFTEVLLERDVSNRENVNTLRRLYDVHVREIDVYFADLMDCLDSLALLSETAIIVTNDHGDEFAEHGGLSHDDKMYSELIDAPLFIYGAGEAGTCSKVVSNADIPPTIVSLLGLPTVDEFQGCSIIPSACEAIQRGAFGEALDQRSKKGGDPTRDIYFYREGDLKIIHRPEPESWELYDLASDPQEQANIVESSPSAEHMKSMILPRVRRWIVAPRGE